MRHRASAPASGPLVIADTGADAEPALLAAQQPSGGGTPTPQATARILQCGLGSTEHAEVDVDSDGLVLGIVTGHNRVTGLVDHRFTGDDRGTARGVDIRIIPIAFPRTLPAAVQSLELVRGKRFGVVEQNHA
ncbi:Uncharacterised protein [Mycobacteroides abscessus subsp. massiliense]|nr:Uncharacterised protein [Mycobacteroides abscessus subsp. massiliense]